MADSSTVRRSGFLSPAEMIQEMNVTQNTPTYRPIFDNFLLNKQPVFVFLSFGPLCNASGSFKFSKAFCDVEGITKSPAPRLRKRLLAVDMDDLFNRGYRALEAEETNQSSEEKCALNELQNFLSNIDVHQRNLVKAFEKIKEEQPKEPYLSVAFVEHLFSVLASEYSFGIDSRMQGKIPSCMKSKRFAATGIGHPKTWHGYVDMIISDNEGHPIGAVVLADSRLFEDRDDDDDDGPTTAKRTRHKDDTFGTSQYREVSGISDQTFAQTVVFALARKQCNPDVKTFVPTILITQKEFFIIMYDPNNDILVRSQKISLWSLESSSCLQEEAVILLWMTLHCKLFCSGAEIFGDTFVDEIKARFMKHVMEDKKKFYRELDMGVTVFETEEKEELSRDLAAYSFYKILKKEKRL